VNARSVIITGIGGSIGLDIARCLRADPDLRLVGCDSNPWALRQASALVDLTVAVPRADSNPAGYFGVLSQLVSEQSAVFVFLNADAELAAYAEVAPTFSWASALPSPELTKVCLDKEVTYQNAASTGLFARTIAVKSEDDVDAAFAEMPGPLWMRASKGSGGKGSLEVRDAEEARAWMRYWNRRGKGYDWLLHEFLPGANINWTGLFESGRLQASAALERESYFLGENTASGISGQVAHCETVEPSQYTQVCESAIHELEAMPHGLFSVDLRLNSHGYARITEINARLAGRPYLYMRAGVNLPLAAVRCLNGQVAGDALDEAGLRVGLHLHRQLDMEPVVAMKRQV
jgi:biotin carboxylase